MEGSKSTMDIDLSTDLYNAILFKNKELVKDLLNNGAYVNTVYDDDCTPLLIATYNGDIQCMKVLLEYGADVNKENSFNGETPLFSTIKYNNSNYFEVLLGVGRYKKRGRFEDYIERIKLLLEYGADVNKANNDGETPINFVLKYNGMHDCDTSLLLDAIYKDIVDKVLLLVSKYDIIFDIAFHIFKTVLKKTIITDNFDLDDKEIHNNLYNFFQSKFIKS